MNPADLDLDAPVPELAHRRLSFAVEEMIRPAA
jgi:hypothetical protein